MNITTKFLKDISIDEKQVFEFASPIIGFEGNKKFALLDTHSPPFYYLQSLEDVSVCFVLLSPYFIDAGYQLDILDSFFADIQTTKDKKEDVLVFCIVNIPENEQDTTINMFAPIIMNKKTNLACQSIQNNDKWKIKTNISTHKV